MKRLYTFKDKVYYVIYHYPERMWPEITIYSYNPNKLFFKKHRLSGYNVVILQMIVEARYNKTFRSTSEIMDYAIRDYLKLHK